MAEKWDSQVQSDWKWPVAADLFLAGTGAGGYATGVLASYGGAAWESVARTGIALGFPLLVLASIFLIADLGVKTRAMKVILNPGTSWIARGSLFISGFMALAAAHTALLWMGGLAMDGPLLRLIGAVNFVLAILVMIYTGVLLSASRSIAFWNTAMLPLLFLLSAFTMGIMAIVLLSPSSPAILSQVLLVLLVLQSIVVAFYIQASHRTDESRASVQLLLAGRLARSFWLGLVGIGLLVPIILVASAVTQGGSSWLVRAASVLGLVGGFTLRRLILAAGVRAPLRAAGIEYTFPAPMAR